MTMVLKGLVALIALLLGVLGLRWVFAPVGAAAELGIALDGPLALNTVRGDIGGLFIGGAILCGIGLARGDGRPLRAAALLLACVAVGRMIGVASDGFVPQAGVAIAVELAMVALLLLAARRLPGANPG